MGEACPIRRLSRQRTRQAVLGMERLFGLRYPSSDQSRDSTKRGIRKDARAAAEDIADVAQPGSHPAQESVTALKLVHAKGVEEGDVESLAKMVGGDAAKASDVHCGGQVGAEVHACCVEHVEVIFRVHQASTFTSHARGSSDHKAPSPDSRRVCNHRMARARG